ncbi:tdpoz4 [Trichonephila clavata]|uniref:Tdpoz4 n=1 Tax=Trichonephila clavata TaxID=2740835 RepID=A0A8X6FTQ4_TRICU|nr:tdpoz4 [Trichonephila clavata]
MMMNDEDEYVIEWKIDNFSTCPLATGQKISTCELTFKNLDYTTWEIHLYPRGKADERYVSCFLARTGKKDAHPRKIYVNFECSVIAFDGLQYKKTVMHDSCFLEPEMNLGFNIVTREDLFRTKETYLMNDTLTLRIRVGKCTPQFERNCYNVIRTRNGVQISNICLPIQNFENVTKGSPEFFRIHTTKEKDFLTLNVYTRKDEVFEKDPEKTAAGKPGESASNAVVHIDIERSKPLSDICPMYVFCSVKLVNKDKSFPLQHEKEYIYKRQQEKEVWNFPRFIKIKELTNNMIQDGTLVLEFNIHVCDGQQTAYLKEESTPRKSKYMEEDKALKLELVSLYKSGLFSDAKLKIGKEYFPVHKSILSIRSSVFKKLFEEHANAVDKNDAECILELTDIPSDTLTRMMDFIYGDIFLTPGFNCCLSLYASAHIYDFPLLKLKCYNYLKDTVSLRQCSEILELAEELNDRDLIPLLKNFMEYNCETFFSADVTEPHQQQIRDLFLELDKKIGNFIKRMKSDI